MEDGSISFIAEVLYVAFGERSAPTHATSLLIVNFGPASSFMTRVPKYNLLGGPVREDQYYAGVCGSKIVLFYRDNPANLERDLRLDAKITHGNKNTILVAATIERDGTISRKKIGDGGNVASGIRQSLQNECKSR